MEARKLKAVENAVHNQGLASQMVIMGDGALAAEKAPALLDKREDVEMEELKPAPAAANGVVPV